MNMTASNKMERFYKKMHKLNSQRIGWIAVWITVLIGIPLCTLSSGSNELGLLYTISAALLIMMSSLNYVKKYMEMDQDDTTQPSLSAMTGSSARFANFMLVHSFDTASYFRILMLRLIPLQLISVIYIVLLKVFNMTDNMPVMIAIVIAVPTLVILLSGLSFRHSLSHEYSLLHRMMRGGVAYIYTIGSFIAYEVYLASLVIIIVAIAFDSLVMKGIEDTEIVRISSSADIWMYIGLISVIVFGYFLNNSLAEAKKGRMIRLAIIAASAVTVVVSMILYIVMSMNWHILLREDSVAVTRSGAETVYELDDVSSYRIYSGKDGMIKMELNFTDGTDAKIFTDSASDTPAWSDRYFSDYNYAADIVTKMNALGIKGTLEDRDKIHENVNTSYDPRCAEGFKVIEDILK